MVFDGNEVAGASFSEVLLPSKREKESEVADDKARCRENEILFSRPVDWDMLACTTYKEREVAMGHGPTECHSILSYMVASHGVPRLQTSLFCFDYI